MSGSIYTAARRYADATEVDRFAWFCETKLIQSVDQFAGRPLKLEGWQKRFLAEALALLGDDGAPEILLAAASDKQAGRMFDSVVSFVRQSPELAAQVHLRTYAGEIARVDGGGKILRMSNDPSTLFGYNPSVIVCDELFAWTKPSHRRAWSALTTAGGARQRVQTFVISTAGEASERDESILGRLLDQNEAAGELEETPGLTVSRNHAARTLIFNYSAPTTDPHDLAAVMLANPASWVTRAYLKRQSVSPEITAGEFLQLHANVWSTSVGAWIPPEAWEACLEPGIAPAAGTDIVCGVDIGLVDDSSAVAVAWQLDDGRIAVDTKVWSARSASAADVHVPGGVIDLQLVEDYLRELHARYRLSVTAYDRRFFERSAALLGLDGLVLAPLEQNSKTWQRRSRDGIRRCSAARSLTLETPSSQRTCWVRRPNAPTAAGRSRRPGATGKSTRSSRR